MGLRLRLGTRLGRLERSNAAYQDQLAALHTQVAEELVAQSLYPVVVCDRSVLDNYVYLLLAAGRQEGLEGMLANWMPGTTWP